MKVAVITGAASGIGRALALELGRDGCALALCDIDRDGLARVQNEAARLGVRVSTHVADVADRTQMQTLRRAVLDTHGRVDILVNNAGVSVDASFAKHSLDDFAWLLGANFWGVLHGCRVFLPELRASSGHIVNVASMYALTGIPLQSSYCASKAAVRGLSETLRIELAPEGISVTCVYPGGVATNIARATRLEPSDDLASWNARNIAAHKELRPPEVAARAIVRGIRKNAARVLIGKEAYAVDAAARFLPALALWAHARAWHWFMPADWRERRSTTVMENLAGRTGIVTGANSGIGEQIAKGLAARGARVVLACRNREAAEQTKQQLVRETGNNAIEVAELDVSEQTSIRRFAARFTERHDALHVLVNNAGIWAKERRLSRDGIEMTWATNVLGPHRLTLELLDVLKRSAPARIVNVASTLAEHLDPSDVEFERRAFDGVRAYAQSKQALRMLTWELSRRLEDSGVTANAVQPGCVPTRITRAHGLYGKLIDWSYRLFGSTPEQGADTPLWLASSPAVDGLSGKFWECRREKPCPYDDPQACAELWRLCDRMIAEPASTIREAVVQP